MLRATSRHAAKPAARLAATLDRISDGIVTLDREWRVVYVNQRGATLLGRTPESLIGHIAWNEFPASAGQPLREALERAMAQREPLVFEEYYAPADRWFESHVDPSAEGMTVVFRDVTGRRRALDRLEDSHARLAEAAAIANFGHWQWEPLTDDVQWSAELFQIYGLQPETFRATLKGYIERVHPDDRERVQSLISRALTGRQPFRFEERIVRPDGEVRRLRSEGRVVPGPGGEVVRLVGVCHDVTDRWRAEESLATLDRQRAAILDAAADGIYGVDADGTTNFVNPAAARMLGYEPAELMGARMHEVVHHSRPDGSHYPVADCPIMRTLVTGSREQRDDEVLWRKDGSSFWAEYTATPLRADGAITGAVIMFRDISERREREEELIHYADRLAGLRAGGGVEGARPRPPARSEPGTDVVRGLVERAVELARQTLDMELAFLGAFLDGEQELRVLDGDAASFGVERGMRLALDETYCWQLVRGDLPNIVADTRVDERVSGLPITEGAGIGAYVAVPIHLASGRLYGTLCCVAHAHRPALDERDVAFLHTLAGMVGDQLARDELETQRRAFETEAATATALLSALGSRDHYTGSHCEAVVELAGAVARELGMTVEEAGDVELVAQLHDIGKVGIPDAVLQKRGKLDRIELKIMREHSAIGARMIASVDALAHLAPMIRAEHERWDGEGYPDGLAGEAIPIASRITLVCGAYHAMASDRPYRTRMSDADARHELELNAGTQFDPAVVAVLLRVLDR